MWRQCVSGPDLALVEVVNDGVIERLLQLTLGVGALDLKLGVAWVITPLRDEEMKGGREGGRENQRCRNTHKWMDKRLWVEL